MSRAIPVPTGGHWGMRETTWAREAAVLADGGSTRRWMLERVVCAHRGLVLTGPDERALVWALLDVWEEHDDADEGATP